MKLTWKRTWRWIKGKFRLKNRWEPKNVGDIIFTGVIVLAMASVSFDVITTFNVLLRGGGLELNPIHMQANGNPFYIARALPMALAIFYFIHWIYRKNYVLGWMLAIMYLTFSITNNLWNYGVLRI